MATRPSDSSTPYLASGRRRFLEATAVALVVGFPSVLIFLGQQVAARESIKSTDPVNRGQYLITVGGCNNCHTPLILGEDGPAPDMSRKLSGHPGSYSMPRSPALGEGSWLWASAATNTAFVGPWGVSYSSNLTPEESTGIGIWSEDIFVSALRTGRQRGVARTILPPMPWQNYASMTDDDLKAIYAYLRSVAPIQNRVPASQSAGG